MIIEEPEAHIHTHIQKTLFDNLQVTHSYTQVIMSTHSTHLSEVSDIEKVNIMKKVDEQCSCVMTPSPSTRIIPFENSKTLRLASKYLDRTCVNGNPLWLSMSFPKLSNPLVGLITQETI